NKITSVTARQSRRGHVNHFFPNNKYIAPNFGDEEWACKGLKYYMNMTPRWGLGPVGDMACCKRAAPLALGEPSWLQRSDRFIERERSDKPSSSRGAA